MKNTHSGREEIVIEKNINNGLALGRLANGKVIQLPHALSGERVVVDILAEKRSYARGRLVDILSASPHRVEPPCPYYFACGGCDLQHLDHRFQAQLKSEAFFEQFLRPFPFAADFNTFPEVAISAPRPFYYRQRIQLRFDESARLGYFSKKSHSVVPISSCMVAREEINRVIDKLSQCSTEDLGVLVQADTLELVSSPLKSTVHLVLNFRQKKPKQFVNKLSELGKRLAPQCQSVWMRDGKPLSTMPVKIVGGHLEDDSDESNQIAYALQPLPNGKKMELRLQPGSFCQVNIEQNENLVRLVVKWAEAIKPGLALDLHCGIGNFALPLAMIAKQVIGSDIQKHSIASARRNARHNQLENVEFYDQAAFASLTNYCKGGNLPDLVLLDPPRQGARELLPLLGKMKVPWVIYVSCDPSTLIRDLQELHGFGYHLERLKLIDMFPQTHHLEAAVCLRLGHS